MKNPTSKIFHTNSQKGRKKQIQKEKSDFTNLSKTRGHDQVGKNKIKKKNPTFQINSKQ